jgi:exonuclease I
MVMLHRMSEVRGWSHDEMMNMSKRVFFRYYGYWYADRLNEERHQQWQEHKQKLNQKSQENRQALGIRN